MVIQHDELRIVDKNIELGVLPNHNDTTADGGGITLKGTTDKTIIWDISHSNWTANDNFNILTGKKYKINNDVVLTNNTLGNNIVNSSLETVGTINTGVWEGSRIDMRYTQLQGGQFVH